MGGPGGFGGGMSMDDIFSQFGDIFGDAFGGRLRGLRRWQRLRPFTRPAVVKGSNLRVRLKLTSPRCANGVEKKIKVNKLVRAEGAEYGTCATCGGSAARWPACRAPSWARCRPGAPARPAEASGRP